jgi:sugar phosphate isomerase/epimerase
MDADPIALIEAAAVGGFDAIGLRVVPPFTTDPIVPVVGATDMQRQIKQRLRETGITIVDIEAVWLKPETRVEEVLPALEIGAELGAKYVLTVGFDDNKERLVENFGKFCGLAHACGLRAMLEFIPYSTVKTLKHAHDLLAAAAPANAGLLIDTLHLSRSGGHPADIAAYDPTLFSYAHLCDAPLAQPAADRLRDEARENRFYPREGELWLDAFLDALPPGIPIAVEAPNAAFTHLPIAGRARLAAEATRRLLRRHGGADRDK